MNTVKIWTDVFIARTTGEKAVFQVYKLTLIAVEVVLMGIQLKLDVEGATEDLKRGYLRRERNSGFYGGNDGYIPTAKGIRMIFKELQRREATHV